MRIIVDQREPIEIMRPLLKEVGFEVEVELLPTADYIIPLDDDNDSRIAITMKSTTDFLSSVSEGHMHSEIEAMLELPDNYIIMLIIWKPTYGWNKAEMMRTREISQTLNLEYISVYNTGNRIKAVELMKKLHHKFTRDRISFPIQFRRRVQLSGNKTTDPVIKLYMNLPGIGEVTARFMKEKYPTISVLISAMKRTRVYNKAKFGTKKSWQERIWYAGITGLGPTLAKEIENIMVGPLKGSDDM